MKQIQSTLIQKCQKGVTEAQMELYNMLFAPVYHTSLRIVGNSADAEDVAQESFLKIFERINQFLDRPQTLEYSLKRIAINASIDVLRRRHIHFVELESADGAVVDESRTEERTIEWEIGKVHDAIEQLPDGFRVVISLKLFEGMDFDEIAQQLGITASTARSQYARARKRLLEML